MIDTQSLRKKILDLAIHGKLTEQFEFDEPAEVLYQRIRVHKNKLISNGEQKKDILVCSDRNEKTTNIPANWKLVTLSSIITLQSGQDLKPEEYNSNGNGIPYLTGASNFDGSGNIIINRWTEHPKNFARKDDILLSCKGTVGKIAILKENHVHIARQFMAIRTYEINVNYVCFYIQSEIEKLKNASKGLIPGIERKDILHLLMPLPPLNEQQRIVTKIEEAFSILNTIDELQERYSSNLSVLKPKLVDLAVQGKLTKQLPEDGTAEELFKQMQLQKENLIKEKKKKKEKALSQIKIEDIPYEIPDNWKWVRVGDIGSWAAGSTPSRKRPDYYKNGTIPWLKTGDLNDGFISEVPEKITEIAFEESTLRINPIGSVLMAMYGATIGKLGILVAPMTTNQACCACIPFNGLYNRYLFYYLLSARTDYIEKGKGGAQPNISKEIIINSLIPLPPLAEQKRIVEELDNIFATLDRVS